MIQPEKKYLCTSWSSVENPFLADDFGEVPTPIADAPRDVFRFDVIEGRIEIERWNWSLKRWIAVEAKP